MQDDGGSAESVESAPSLQPPQSDALKSAHGRPSFGLRKTLSHIRPALSRRSTLKKTASNLSKTSLPLRRTQSNIDPAEEYINPLDRSPRWVLSARAGAIRAAASIGFGIMNMSAFGPTQTVWLDSTLAAWRGKRKIEVKIWDPKQKPEASQSRATTTPAPRRVAVINFHGGGFALGQATDDTWWANAVVKGLDAVVFSVNYRLAPEYPFPTAVEDCADAILQISRRADEFGIDPTRIIITGFSAGGSLSLASWALLQDPERWGYHLPVPAPKIAGFALFYPLLDWTISRPRKRLSCIKPDLTLTKNLTDLFDASYIYPQIPKSDREDPRLSPGLMPEAMLAQMPPLHLCVCQYDMLLAEGRVFANRLKDMGRDIRVREVKEEKHAWDKPPPMWPKPSVHVEYGHAIDAIRNWVDTEPRPEEEKAEKPTI